MTNDGYATSEESGISKISALTTNLSRPIQCSTCIHGNEMHKVEDRQDELNRVTFYIQLFARRYQCRHWQYQQWEASNK